MNASGLPEPSWQNERRERVVTWLRRWSADLADLYLAAVRLLHGPADVPAHLRLAAHAAREILNRLPDFVAPGERRRLHYKNQVDALLRSLPDFPFDDGAPATCTLEGRALETLRQLLVDHQTVGNEAVERARRMFAAATRSTQPELLRPLARRWHGLYDLFVHDVHVADASNVSWKESDYRSRFGQVEDILATLADDFFAPLEELDAVLRDPRATSDDALARAVHTEQLRYLFEKLERPDWVRPLATKGYFASPPLPVLEEGGNFVRFPPWPALGYLARVAARAPSDVLAAALQVPATENVSVKAGLFDIALALPSDRAAKLLPKLRGDLAGSAPIHSLLEHRIESLVGHLAKGGEVTAADELLALAAKVLAPQSGYGSPRTRMPAWAYDRLFSTNIPSLLDADPPRFFKRFIALLRTAVKVGTTKEEARAGRDLSVGWREVVTSGPGHIDDPRDVLVDAVRDAALRLATDAAAVIRIVGELEAERFSIFKRIALHVAVERRDISPESASERVMMRDLFDAYEFRPEYARLVGLTYPDLDDEKKATWLGWIDQGPDLSHLDERHVAGESEPSLEDVKRERSDQR